MLDQLHFLTLREEKSLLDKKTVQKNIRIPIGIGIGIDIGIGLLKIHIAASKAELHEITV